MMYRKNNKSIKNDQFFFSLTLASPKLIILCYMIYISSTLDCIRETVIRYRNRLFWRFTVLRLLFTLLLSFFPLSLLSIFSHPSPSPLYFSIFLSQSHDSLSSGRVYTRVLQSRRHASLHTGRYNNNTVTGTRESTRKTIITRRRRQTQRVLPPR